MNKILTLDELQAKWPGAGSEPRATFDIADVPANLQSLAPYAYVWGIADDWGREDVIGRTPEQLKTNLKYVVKNFDDELDAWLAGPEARATEFTDAYVAFSAMRMAADYM